jgi:hypothetical protein
MDVIIHYPKSEEAQYELRKAVALVHADLSGSYINHLPCSIEQKCKLINSIRKVYLIKKNPV